MAKKNIKKRKFCKPYARYGLGVFLGVLLIMVLVFGLTLFKNQISGRAVFEIETDYQEGQPLEGNLRLSLKEGELISSSSKIIFETSEEKYEYDLSEFVSNDLVEGDFYVEGTSISGTGLGYGTEGTKTIYPDVSFTLEVYSEISSEETEEETEEEETIEEEPEVEEVVIEEVEEIPEETIEEEPEVEETEEETESGIETPITGNIVSRLSRGISNFFLGVVDIFKKISSKISSFFLGLTGRVSLEFETEIQEEVSADEPFTYNLEEDQTAEIVSSSQDVELDIDNGVATVTTSYSEEEEGFGEDYLGDGGKVLDIDLSELDLLFWEEELKISLVYGEEEIISLLTQLGETEEEETIEEESEDETFEEENESLEIEQNITSNETEQIIEEVAFALTDGEREILVEKFGEVSVEITKAELVNGRIVLRYELGDYWFEPSYDSELSEEDLKLQMESDEINWLKDMANTLSQEETVYEEVIF